MLLAMIACGGILVIVGVFGLVRPSALQRFVATMTPGKRYALAVGIRVALGVFLLLAAPEARWPIATRVFGGIALLAAVVIFAMGPGRLDRVVQWWSSRPLGALRVAAGGAVAVGALAVVNAL